MQLSGQPLNEHGKKLWMFIEAQFYAQHEQVYYYFFHRA